MLRAVGHVPAGCALGCLFRVAARCTHSDWRCMSISVSGGEIRRTLTERAVGLLSGSGEHSSAQKGALFAYAIRIASAAIAYLSQVILARSMGTFEFGIFAYVWVWVIILGTFVTVGLNTSCMRFLPEYFERSEWGLFRGFAKASASISFGVGTLAALGGIALVLALGDSISSYYVMPFVLAFACLPSFALSDTMDGTARSRSWIHLALIPPYIVRPILILVFMAASVGLGAPATATTAMAGAIAATWLVAAVQTTLVHRRLLKDVEPVPARYELGLWIKVSIPIVLMDSFYLVMTHADIMIMNMFVGPTQIAIYYAVVKTTSLIAFVFFAVTASFGPKFAEYKAAGRSDELHELMRVAINWTFWPSLVTAAGMLAIGFPLLWLFGSEFTEGYPMMFILVIGLLARASTGPVETMMIMLGHQNIIAVSLCASMVVNIVLNLVLIPAYGLPGAAVATTISIVLLSVLQFVFARRRLGVHAFVFGSSLEKE